MAAHEEALLYDRTAQPDHLIGEQREAFAPVSRTSKAPPERISPSLSSDCAIGWTTNRCSI